MHVKVERPRCLILFSHGNTENLRDLLQDRDGEYTPVNLPEVAKKLSCDIVSYDYPCVGLSTGVLPNMTRAEHSLDRVFNYMVNIKGYKPCSIVLFGF